MAVPEGCPLDIDPVEIGKLIAQVETLSARIEESNRRIQPTITSGGSADGKGSRNGFRNFTRYRRSFRRWRKYFNKVVELKCDVLEMDRTRRLPRYLLVRFHGCSNMVRP